MEEPVSANKMGITELAEMRDKISGLPNPLLHHILSFLPAQEAVATSLLSKEWASHWVSLSTLHISSQHFKSITFFHQFVDKLLEFVDLKFINKFVLHCHNYKSQEYCYDPDQKIIKWIDVMISNNVEHMDLNLYSHSDCFELPSGVFTSNNIKVLKLTAFGVESLGILSHVNLPMLEVLHVIHFKVPDVRSLEILLSSCPLLKDLVLTLLDFSLKRPLNIEGLHHLVTARVPKYLRPWKVLSNVTFLRFGLHDSLLCIDIPTFYNLTYLEFNYYSYNWETTLKLLQSCPKLEILVFCEFAPELRFKSTTDVPQCVSSNLKEFHLRNYEGSNDEIDFTRYFMKNARVLRIISIRSIYRHEEYATLKNNTFKEISSCPMSSVNCRLLLD